MTTDLGPTGRRIAALEPGSDLWLNVMSASKIAAVVGLSPYESRFSLWHRMARRLPERPPEPHLLRGHYLEAGIAAWFADQHPDWQVKPASTWAHPDEPRCTATPDRELHLPDGEIRGLELKTAADADEWGEPGTDQIPAGYLAQVRWQMLCAGYRTTHVAVLSAYLELREYVVEQDDTDAAYLTAQARAFLDSLPDGPHPQRPDLDSHNATYEAVRQMHPGIDDRKVEIDTDIALRYQAADAAAKAAQTELTGAKTQLLDAMGDARLATHLDVPIARRQPARGTAVALYSLTPKDPS